MDPEQTVDRLLERWEAAQREGQPLTAAELCADAPELEATLQGRIQALEAMARLMAVEETTEPEAERGPGPSADGATRPLQLQPSVTWYESIEHHASGGLGEVYRVRDDQFGREVALKRIRPGQAHSTVASRRFDREIQISGRLEHPGIVPIYGRGRDEQGHAYYTMRLIRGETLSRAIERLHRTDAGARRVALRNLLARFVTVCQTIAYAHSQRIVHRDLKPDNIMLGPFGETLVVDWGLARPFDAPADDDATSALGTDAPEAQSLGPVGTPRYMSPEQAEGRPVGPPSDIYSLGGNLYCLLTNQPPIEGNSLGAILEGVRAGRIVRPREWCPEIPAALEAVCLKALALRPEDRYSSAQELADDVERWLADEPVQARPEPWPERARRWARRHRTGVTGAAAAGLAGLVGLAAVLAVQTRANVDLKAANRREVQKFALALEAIKLFQGQVGNDQVLKSDAFKPLRDQLLKAAADFYRKLEQVLHNQTDRDSRRAMGMAYSELGELTGQIGDRSAALAAHENALTVRRKLAGDPAATTEAQVDLAQSLLASGVLLQDAGRSAEGLTRLEEARTLLAGRPRSGPGSEERLALLGKIDRGLGVILERTGKPSEALSALQRSLETLTRLVDRHTAETEHLKLMADTLVSLGIVQRKAGDASAAAESYRQALDVYRRLIADRPAAPEFRIGLARTHNNLGFLRLSMGEPARALESLQVALGVYRTLTEDNPAITDYRNLQAIGHINIGRLRSATGEPEAALEAYRQALAILERLAAENPTVASFGSDVSLAQNNIGAVLSRIGQPAAALESYQRALAVDQRLVDADPGVTEFRSSLGRDHNNIGLIQADTGQPEAALESYRQAVAILERLAADHPSEPDFRDQLANTHGNAGELHARNGRFAEALASYRQALRIQEQLAAESPGQPDFQLVEGRELNHIGDVYIAMGQSAEADATFEKAAGIHERLGTAYPAMTEIQIGLAGSTSGLGRAQRLAHHPAEATASLHRAIAIRDPLPTALTEARYELARDRAVLVDLAMVPGSGLSSADGMHQATLAMAALRQAVAAGFQDVPRLQREADFDPLRGRADFQLLMMDLTFPAHPFAP